MIRIFAPGFLLGAVLLHQQTTLPSPWWLLLVPFLFFTLYIYRRRWLIIIPALLAGVFWSGVQAGWRLQQAIPGELHGRDVLVTGVVSSLPESTSRRQRFELKIEQVNTPANAFKAQTVRLNWYDTARPVRAGQRWQFWLRLKPARNFANPGMFNYTGWLWQKGIRYTGYVRHSEQARLISNIFVDEPLQRWRNAIRERMQQQLGDLQYEPVFRALLIGDRSDMTAEHWHVFQKTGTVHLVAISGLHIGLIAGFVFLLSRYAWSRFPRACLLLAAPRAAAIMSILSALIYAALAGFSLPTQRALIMLSVVMIALIINRRIRSADVLSAALLMVLVFDSFAVLSASFWLSFAAVAVILLVITTRRHSHRKLKTWIDVQLIIGLGLIPFTSLFFQQASLIAPVANAVAIPLVTFIIVPMCFISFVLLMIDHNVGEAVFSWLDTLFGLLWRVLDYLATIPGAAISLSSPTLLAFCLACTGIIMLILPSTLAARFPAMLLLLPLFFSQSRLPGHGEVHMTVLDVGQGLSAVVRTREHVLVFDSGARFSDRFDLGSAVVVPFLRQHGINHIDQLLISHGDNDHIGGSHSIMDAMNIDRISSSVPQQFAGASISRCEAGQRWQWNGVTFTVLHPAAQDYHAGLSENNLSCVIQVQTDKTRILLTGDIEAEAESLLVERYGAALKSDYLLVPHHGSKTSSTPDFTSQVKPKVAIIPVGWRNRYGLPHANVIARYERHAVDWYSTARDGAVMIQTDDETIDTYRPRVRRYWDGAKTLK